jgi:hypothetical protein
MNSNIRIFMAMALPVLAFALTPSAAMAQSYSGNWPLIVTHSQHSNGEYCVTLTDDGGQGWPHSGSADIGSQIFGTFQLIDGLLTMTISKEWGNGMNIGLVFVAPAAKGQMHRGIYDDVLDGSVYDSGVLAVGKKGGC